MLFRSPSPYSDAWAETETLLLAMQIQNILISCLSVTCDPITSSTDISSDALMSKDSKREKAARWGGEENRRQARLIRHLLSQAWGYIPQHNLPAGEATTQTHQRGSLLTVALGFIPFENNNYKNEGAILGDLWSHLSLRIPNRKIVAAQV